MISISTTKLGLLFRYIVQLLLCWPTLIMMILAALTTLTIRTPTTLLTTMQPRPTILLHKLLQILYNIYPWYRYILNRATIQAQPEAGIHHSPLQDQMTETSTLFDCQLCWEELDATLMLPHPLIFLLTHLEMQALVFLLSATRYIRCKPSTSKHLWRELLLYCWPKQQRLPLRQLPLIFLIYSRFPSFQITNN